MKILALVVLSSCLAQLTAARELTLRTLEEIVSVSNNAPIAQFDTIGQIISKRRAENIPGHRPGITLVNGLCRIDLVDISNDASYNIGDIVRVIGFIDRDNSSSTNGILATKIIRQGSADFPPQTTLIPSAKCYSRHLAIPVSYSGVVVDVFKDELSKSVIWIVLETDAGPVSCFAYDTEYQIKDVQDLLDAEIEIRGLRTLLPNRWQAAPNLTQLYGSNGIRILKQPITDPLDAPQFHTFSLHRQKISGTVIGKTRNSLFVTTHDKTLISAHLANQTSDIEIGDHVIVAGFPIIKRYGTSFVKSIVRKLGEHSDLSYNPIAITGQQLLLNPDMPNSVNYHYHGKTITIKGTLCSDATETSTTGILRLNCERREVEIDITGLPGESIPSFERGSTLSVSGVYVIEFENGSGIGLPRFRRCVLIPRSHDDIRLVARPTGWITSILLSLVTILTILLIAVLVWIKTLKALSERCGHALYLARAAQVRAESRTQERTRLALELHDSISQSLTGIALQIDAATTATQKTPNICSTYLSTAKLLLASCRKELQGCLWDLRSRTFEEKDMTEAILRTLYPYRDDCIIFVRFNVPRENISESATHAVLAIVRELTANAIRHGHAQHVRIAGEFRDHLVRFSVSDDGSGFDLSAPPGPRDGHFGLQGIRERVNDFNGKIEIFSQPNEGTKVLISFNPDSNVNKNA